ncbi:hypothetical protein ES702_02345 [subsurface metagenome]
MDASAGESSAGTVPLGVVADGGALVDCLLLCGLLCARASA